MAYDNNNIFAKILRGEMPSHKVYEDADTFAFMDIMPRCQGTRWSSRRRPHATCSTPRPQQLGGMHATVQKIARASMKAFAADGITVQQFNEPAGGQVVFHIHFHVLPRWDGVKLQPHTGQMEKPEVLAANAENIRHALAG